MEILAVEDLSFTYPESRAPALQKVSFSVEQGSFTVLCGATGSGKSTLLRMLKRELAPLGERIGAVRYRGTSIEELDDHTAAASIGFVLQRPEQQIVTDKVWHELAFGLENLGISRERIALRIAEMASYFGIEDWYARDVSTLSGGQKQLLSLAAVMVMHPDVLILDEPTAQLDPIAAADFIGILRRLNRDLGQTILLSEHRLEEAIPICDKLMVMEQGGLLACDAPRKVIPALREHRELLCGMPAASRLYAALEPQGDGACPLTVREGRAYLEEHFRNDIPAPEPCPYTHAPTPALSFKDVCFRYEKDGSDVLSELSFTVYENEIFCILGGNGSGKTTALSAAAGLLRPYSGQIRVFGKKLREYKNQELYRDCLAMLPQDVQTVFLCSTVREELAQVGAGAQLLPFDLTHLSEQHPYDLSGGEQQLLGIAKVLAARPRLLLLDEPTKGLDAGAKEKILSVLRALKERGVTVVIVTHDVEFAAAAADRCALFFRGSIVSVGTPAPFFSDNSFYTTAVRRITRGYYDGVVTLEAAAELCRRNGKRGADG